MNWLPYKNAHFFRFWCYKILPLVYDDSLSYYEVLCKIMQTLGDMIKDLDAMKENIQSLKDAFDALKFYVDNYFDNLDIQEEINNFMQTLVESGELDDMMAVAINGTLVDTSYYKPVGQILPQSTRLFNTGLYPEGFTIGVVNDRPIALTCFTDGTASGTGDVLCLDYFDTGVNISRNNVPAGHCNGACFNSTTGYFYIVTGGIAGSPANIIEYSVDGTVNNTIDIGYDPWAIAWTDDKFYITVAGARLVVCDNDFNILSITSLQLDATYTYQGMMADSKYLYFPNGNNRTTTSDGKPARNRISVFLHNGQLYKHIEVMIPIEVEGLALYRDRCYASCNSQSAAMIFETDLYTKTADCYIELLDLEPSIVNYIQTIYVDETYAGFKMDGSAGYPVSSLYWWYMCVKPNTTRINVELMSDAADKVFAEFGAMRQYVQLDGHNHKIAHVNWNGCNILGLKDIVLLGENNGVSCHVTASRFIASGLVFGETNSAVTPLRCLEVVGSPCEIISVTFNQSSSVSMYLIGGGYLRGVTVNIDHLNGVFLGGVFDVDDDFPISKIQVSNNYGMSYHVKCKLGQNLDVSTLYYPMIIDIAPGSYTLTGLPTGVDSDDVTGIIVNAITQNKASLDIYLTDGTVVNKLNTRVL